MTPRTKQNLVDLYPLTPLQQGILFHALAAEHDPYLVRLCFRIDGAVDGDALHAAWQAVVDRHEALRADLEWVKTRQPIELVFRNCPVDFEQLRWDDAPAGELDDRLRALVDAAARRFALSRAADQRVVLVRAGADRSFLVWIFHHVLLDGWSVANVLGEVLACYRAATTGSPADLPTVPPYTSYLAALRAHDAAAAEAYWRTALTGYAPPEFPPRRPEATTEATTDATDGAQGYAERTVVFDAVASAALRALASDHRVTLSTCLQAAVALLIKAYTGSDDVVFGATVAGRPAELAGAAAMVGAFINTVPVRIRARGDDTLPGLLARLHRDAGERRDFEHLGLPRIQELAATPPGPPLFESILVVENFPVTEVLRAAEGLAFSASPHPLTADQAGAAVGRGRNSYPVSFIVLPGRRIELILAYHRDRVDDATAAAMLDRLAAIVRGLSAAAGAPLAALDGGPRAAPAPARPAPESFQPIGDRIAARATATPHAIAVVCEAAAISYAELDARAHRLAAALAARGVTPGARVGVCLPRSIDFVVALYAALRLGAAYVPLDPAQPRARLAGLIDDARLTALVTERARRADLDGLHPALLACDDLPPAATTVLPAALHPETPAYLIYTSGSTGTPKGVAISHRALGRYVTSVLERLALPPGASLAMVSTVAADLGHTALFGALCSGGTLHLITDERAADPDGFADYMARHQVDALKIVPGHLWGLLQTAAPERALPRHVLVIGGEAAPPALLAYLRRQRRCRVVNHYGPTETTVGVLTHELPREPAAGGAAIPLGQPLRHARAHLLGPDLRPVPAGAIGEIYLGGDGLAAGYFQRPQLTAERFVPDPWSGEPGARLYRTGDRGRQRGDGAFEFLGRADDQIKLRGFRIEPGEIRAELLRLPGVHDARVVARPGPAGAPALCAYLVGAPPAGSPPPELALRARLPAPMVPAAYVWLERFPITANGKIDLARLPAPDAAPPGSAAPAGGEPASDAERALAAIWRDSLGCPAIGRDDHFFQLGGDSILALKVVARARRAGWKLTPRQLHAHPTLAAAARVAQPIAKPPVAQLAAPAAPATPDAHLTPIQRRFLDRQRVDPHHYNQAILLALAQPVAPDVVARAVAQLTAHHAALRLRFDRAGDRWSARYAAASTTDAARTAAPIDLRRATDSAATDPAATDLAATAFVVRVDLRDATDPAAAIDRACDELQRGFDLARGPLLRAGYLDLGPDREPRLLLVAHHLVVDGVSWRILLEDLAELLAGAPALAAPTTAFEDFAQRLHHHARGPTLQAELAYWQRVVAPSPDDRDDAPRHGANTVGDAATVAAELDAATTTALLSRAPRAYATHVHDLLLAALGRVLGRAWQRSSVLVAVEGHGRDEVFDGVDLSRTVGWFSTIYPVRLAADPADDRGHAIRTTRDLLRQVPGNGLGYGLLRQTSPALAAAPEPRVTFNYLGQFDQAFAGQDLFRAAPETSGRRRSPHTPRDGWFVINAIVHGGLLVVEWEYSRALHDRGEVDRLLADYLAELRAQVQWCEAVIGASP